MLCTLGACAPLQGAGGPRASETPAHVDVSPTLSWWDKAGDPLLARLIDDGLAADARLRREAQALAAQQARTRQWQYRVVQWVARTLHEAPQPTDALALRLQESRLRKAARIARAYVDVRSLQSRLALRQAFQDQFHDDADLARWRHEAGLVSGVDNGLAATLVGVNASALGTTRTRLAEATAALARRTGLASARLELMLDDGARVPRLAWPAAPAPCHAAVVDPAGLAGVERDAERTARDARAAYQLGTGDFATLYVAQTAVVHAREASVAEATRQARAAVDAWTDHALRLLHGEAQRGAASAQHGACDG